MPAKKKDESQDSTTTPRRKRRTADEILKDTKAEPKTTKKTASKSSTPKKATEEKPIRRRVTRTTVKKEASEETPKKTTRAKKTLSELAEEESKSGVKATKKADIVEEVKKTRTTRAKKAATAKEENKTTKKSPAKRTTRTKKTPSKEDANIYETPLTLSWRAKDTTPKKTKSASKKEREQEKVIEEEPQQDAPTYDLLKRPKNLDGKIGRVKIIAWRPKPEAPAKKQKRSAKKQEQKTEISTTFRATKSKREKAKVQEDKVAQPEPPKIIIREPVPRSEEAAQVVIYKDEPVLIKNKKIYAPMMFSAPAETPEQVKSVLEEAKYASENNINLFMLSVRLEVNKENLDTTIQHIGEQIERYIKVNKEAQFILRVNIEPATGWESQFKDSVYDNDKLSFCCDEFWSEAESVLTSFTEKLLDQKYADQLMGLHIDRNEWYYADGVYDDSGSADQQFRAWLRHRYRDDIVTLRASWFDGSASFDTLQVPEYPKDQLNDIFHTDRKARKYIDYHLFLSDMIVERIGDLCYAAKKASSGNFLIGVSYGYTFEWSYPSSGHLSLGKLLRCPEVDYIAGPPSYRFRNPGESAPFPFPVDSFALNGKLFISEADYQTSMGSAQMPNLPVMKTPQALEAAHWRDAGCALAHNGGICWSDSQGHGWLNSRSIWERAGKMRDTLFRRHAGPQQTPDVAVFVDERSIAYLVDSSAIEDLIQNVREDLIRAGLNVGFYLLSDLAHRETFPDAKLYIFVNAWDIRPEVRAAIKSRLQRDNKVLFWLYCAGMFEAGRDSLERVREVTGIPLRPQPFACKSGTTLVNNREPLAQQLPEDKIRAGGRLKTSYFAIPEDSLVLGEYTQTGLPSFVMKRFQGDIPEENWTTVFLGEPVVSPGLFRTLAQMAGAHVWNFENDVVHATPPFLTVHCTGAAQRTITLPDKWAAFNINSGEYLPVENNSIKFMGVDGITYSFIVGPIGDVQSIVNTEVEDLRQINEPILRDENTLHWDTIQFDVPIMKLDEWMEESWSDDHADDLLLKPSMIDIDTESLLDHIEEPPERNRRRRKRRGRRGSEETADSRKEGADQEANQYKEAGVSVLFRKRD